MKERKKEFDYYIYIDYSENLIGYSIIEKSKIRELLPKISKLAHYVRNAHSLKLHSLERVRISEHPKIPNKPQEFFDKEIVHKRAYLSAIRKRFEREEIRKLLLKWKIRGIRENTEIFSDVLEFIKYHDNCVIFLSVDNNQYKSFLKLFEIIPHKEHIELSQESCLKKGSIECRLSYVIDNLLNIRRTHGV